MNVTLVVLCFTLILVGALILPVNLFVGYTAGAVGAVGLGTLLGHT